MKTLFICPWFGDFPAWMSSYLEQFPRLKSYGFDFHITQDAEDFSSRVQRVLGHTPEIRAGSPLVHNYRTAYGLLYADLLKDYDFWGITDFDCVYGNLPKFLPELTTLDIHSNHHNYICGPWTLFRNTSTVNELFKSVPNWQSLMTNASLQPGRWTEVEYSNVVDGAHEAGQIRRLYTHLQGLDPNDDTGVKLDGDTLTDHGKEIMMFHCNRNKRWPL